MTKTLTEQWREGTLPEGYYYTKVINILDKERIMIDYYISELHHFEIMPSEYVKEVIVEAPSYDEYNKLRKLPLKCFQLEEDNSALVVINKDMCKEIERLQKQLEIATKALNGIRDVWANNPSQFSYIARIANRKAKTALEEMEGVK